MTRIRILLLALLVQAAFGQEPSRPSIEGSVISSAGRTPISGAAVELTHVENGRVVSRVATTDSTGKFAFRDLPSGSGYQLVVTGPGLRPIAYGQRTTEEPWKPLALDAGQQLRDIQIVVPALTAIRGRIINERGEPVGGATVMPMRPVYIEGRRVLQSLSSTVTNMRGEYRVSGLPAGPYYVRVMPRNGDSIAETFLTNPARLDRSVEGRKFSFNKEPEGYPVLYYPGTSVEQAKAIYLGDGTVANDIDIRIARVRTGRVRGTVQANGRPAGVSQVLMVRKGGALESNWTRSFDSKNGQFDLRGVLPGSYFLTASTEINGVRLWGRVPVDVPDGELRTVDVNVSPEMELKGRFVFEEGTAPANPAFSNFALMLLPDLTTPTDGALSNVEIAAPASKTTPDSTGAFTFRNLVPWNYRPAVDTGGLRGAYVKSIKLGGKDVLSEGLSLPSTPAGELEIVLSMKGGTLEGRIIQDNPETAGMAARAVLVPESRYRHDLFRTVLTDAKGEFEIPGIAPGKYKVFAWRYVPESAWLDPDFLVRFEEHGALVQVEENRKTGVEVRVAPR